MPFHLFFNLGSGKAKSSDPLAVAGNGKERGTQRNSDPLAMDREGQPPSVHACVVRPPRRTRCMCVGAPSRFFPFLTRWLVPGY